MIAQYERQGHPYYASARLWDDGVIDPVQSRTVLALALAACQGPSRAPGSTASSGCKEFICQTRSSTIPCPFRLERHGPVIELVLARPARHNAIDADLMQGLLDCLDELAHGQPLADRPTCCCCAPRGAFLRGRRSRVDAQDGRGAFDPAPLTRIARTPGCWPT